MYAYKDFLGFECWNNWVLVYLPRVSGVCSLNMPEPSFGFDWKYKQ